MSITTRLKPIEDSREPMLSVYDSILGNGGEEVSRHAQIREDGSSFVAHTNRTSPNSLYIWAGFVLIHTRIWWASGLHGNLPLAMQKWNPLEQGYWIFF
jgi:hypothetical protein